MRHKAGQGFTLLRDSRVDLVLSELPGIPAVLHFLNLSLGFPTVSPCAHKSRQPHLFKLY